MESKPREQEAMNPMSMDMNSQTMNSIRGYPYYIPDISQMSNCPQMSMYNNMPQMNDYPYQTEQSKEEQQMDMPTTPENKSIQKNKSLNASLQEKRGMKSYISLLINTVENLMKEGKVTMKYLKEKTEVKSSNNNQNNNRNFSESSSSPSLLTMASYKKVGNENQKNLNNIHENEQCENPLCKYNFASSKDKFKIKIKGLKPQEKLLCKKCCDSVENGHFCYYCNAIYRDNMTDAAKWVQCDKCMNWEHFDCELHKGKRYSSVQELNDVKSYICPICINKKNDAQKNEYNKIQKKLLNKKRRGDVFDDQKCKKNQRKDLRNLKSEKCSDLLKDVEDMEIIQSCDGCK